MTRPMFRVLAVAASLVALTACSENSPVAPSASDASFASGSSSTTTSAKREIVLVKSQGSPYASAKGKAKYVAKSGERELQAEVENVPAGAMITFSYNGAAIGTVAASALGTARLNLNSTLGQTVPMVATGGKITASNAANAEIVNGTF